MKSPMRIAFAPVLSVIAGLLVSAHCYAQPAREIAQRVFPSVVLLVMEDEKGQPVSLGSGFFMSEEVVATNLHVVQGAWRGYAKIVGQKPKLDIAGIIGIDARRDLVLLKVKDARAPALRIGDDTKMAVGDTVYVVGNPEGLEGTFSQGIVSGIRQVEGDKLLQITAPISPGSSGGPLLNGMGEVIGVAASTYRQGQNLNFAVPSSYLRALVAEARPMAPLSAATAAKSTKSITAGSGEPSVDGVVALNFRWNSEENQYSGYPSAYTFTLRNKLREPVTNIMYVVIFYGSDGEPIHSELTRYGQQILGSLAKTLNSDPLSGRDAPYPGHQVRKLTSRVEVRILDFRVIRD